jgi:predicted nucleic acid-binding protein
LKSQRGIISSQVVQEFLSVSQRRFVRPLSVSEARDYLRAVLLPICRHYPSAAFYDRALLLREEMRIAFYDALILTAALDTRCSVVLSEDLQSGRTMHGVRIVNPFDVGT